MPPRPPPPTHFLCIPLAGPQLARSLAAFRAEVSGDGPGVLGVPAGAVRPLGTLHLTLGVMSLRDDDALRRALDMLRSLQPTEALKLARATKGAADEGAARHPGLSITLQGLHPMQAASKTSVLYAAPSDPEGVLLRFCQAMREPFLNGGLITDERPLLLHATIVNTIYVKGRAAHGADGRRRRQRLTLDARDLLARYENYVWTDALPVNRVALCRMGAKKIEGSEGDEAYEVEEEVVF